MKTLSEDGSIPSEAMSREIFDGHLRHWDEHAFGIWLFSAAVDDAGVGYCGLRKYDLKGAQETELFFGVRSKYFQTGYGTEMARAVTVIGFDEIGASSIIGFTLEDNIGSRALMTKIGMVYEGVNLHAGLPPVTYRLTR